jgi:oxygen-independent coproporphyrinogen-3 oxidase
MNAYVHIPFCRSRCAYCGFLSHFDTAFQNKYILALLAEISKKRTKLKNEKLSTIFFGGGTPSYISPKSIELIIDKLKDRFSFNEDIEISLETNPEDISDSKLKDWKSAGINRISIGVQSFNNQVRKKMGRKLTSFEVLDKIRLTQKYFSNIGIDLISGLPEEDIISFCNGIKSVSKLGVSHISLYDFEIASGSKIARNPEKYKLKTEEEKEEFLRKSWNLLNDLGFRQYEISNFCKNDKFCKHNLDFWQGDDYIGFGLGAVSRIGESIITNTKDFNKYLEGDLESFVEKLDEIESAKLNLILALRIDLSASSAIIAYEEAVNKSLEGKLLELSKSGLYDLIYNKLTRKGKLLHDSVIEFLLN